MSRSVLHVSQPTEGGVPGYVLAMSRAQSALGWEPVVACPPEGHLWASLDDAGISRTSWPASRYPDPRVAVETARLRRIIRELQPTVVHLHSSKPGLAGRIGKPPRPTVFQPHGWSWDALPPALRPAAELWERRAAPSTDALICVSRSEMEAGKKRGLKARWEVIPNGVDLTRFEPAGPDQRARARGSLELPAQPLAVCIGMVRPAKGQDVLVDVWPAVRDLVPGATLAIVGGGPNRASLAARAPAGVVFAGHRSDVESWLAAADVVVIPSRREAMSLTMLEAMAVGRSIVSTDVPGAREAIEPGAGAVVPQEDPQALAAALAARLLDQAAADREGRVGRDRAASRFGFARTCEAMLDLYERILGERSP